MSDTLKILEKAMNRSNGKAKIVDVPAERIPNHQQLKKLDTEILAQVGIYANPTGAENENNMDIVEYVEDIMNMKLLGSQKYYLTKMYDIYKNNPDSFNKLTCWRGSANIDIIPLLSVMFRLFDLLQQKGAIRNEQS